MANNWKILRIIGIFIILLAVVTAVGIYLIAGSFKAHNYIALSECDMHRHPAAVFTDEIFRSNAVRITHSHSLKRFGRPDFFRCIFGRSGILLTAVCILFVSLKLKAGNVSFSLKTIIKYIQDQDGIKI